MKNKSFFRWICVLACIVYCLICTRETVYAIELERIEVQLQNRSASRIIYTREELATRVSQEERAYWSKFRSDYIYNQLSDAEKTWWDMMEDLCIVVATETETYHDGFGNAAAYVHVPREEMIRMGWNNLEYDDLSKIFCYSNPQYYFLRHILYGSYYEYTGEYGGVSFYIDLYDEFADESARAAYTEEFCERVDSWVTQISAGEREADKYKILCDIISTNIVYESGEFDQSVYSAVSLGETVCAGYTKVFSMLMNAVGIETFGVTSRPESATGHAWNVINMHGFWYYVDVTGLHESRYDHFFSEMGVSREIDAEWLRFLPEVKYSRGSEGRSYGRYSYLTPYFEKGNYVYYIVNGDILCEEGLLATVIETKSGASIDDAPQSVYYGGMNGEPQGIYRYLGDDDEPEIYIWDGGTYTVIQPNVDSAIPGANGLAQGTDGNWYYYRNGLVDWSYNGLAENEHGWWYVSNGKVDYSHTGLYYDARQGWWLVRNGQVAFDYNGLWYDTNCGWWLVEGGTPSFGFTGLYNDANYGWWLVGNGTVVFDYNGLWNDPNYGWWLVEGGTPSFGFTGLYNDANCGWWLVCNGQVVFDYSGLWYDTNCGWWLVEGGTPSFGFTGLYNDANYGWWLIENGTVMFDYNGLWNDPNYGWWLVSGGTPNFGYTGLYNDANCGWWLIGNGSVAFDYTGLWNDPCYGWWYVEGGTVNFGYTGFVQNEAGWWYVENGAINFEYNGM